MAALKANSTLTSINLNNNDIGNKEAVVIAAPLEAKSTLTSINLNNNNIGHEVAMIWI